MLEVLDDLVVLLPRHLVLASLEERRALLLEQPRWTNMMRTVLYVFGYYTLFTPGLFQFLIPVELPPLLGALKRFQGDVVHELGVGGNSLTGKYGYCINHIIHPISKFTFDLRPFFPKPYLGSTLISARSPFFIRQIPVSRPTGIS